MLVSLPLKPDMKVERTSDVQTMNEPAPKRRFGILEICIETGDLIPA